MAEQDVDELLAGIAKRTASVTASPTFVDRTMAAVRAEAGADATLDPADRLDAIRARTEGLRPPEDLTDRVMDAVRASGPVSMRAPSSARVSKRTAFADGLARSGIRAMALAAAVAAACIIYSTIAERALDTHLVSTMDPVEGTD